MTAIDGRMQRIFGRISRAIDRQAHDVATYRIVQRDRLTAVALGKDLERTCLRRQRLDANRAARSGEDVFKAQCSACHGTGAAGAPKFGDAGAWGARIGKGYDALLTSALKGKGAMGPQGGGDFEDFEIGRGVVYMANAAGGKFTEPKKPEAK